VSPDTQASNSATDIAETAGVMLGRSRRSCGEPSGANMKSGETRSAAAMLTSTVRSEVPIAAAKKAPDRCPVGCLVAVDLRRQCSNLNPSY